MLIFVQSVQDHRQKIWYLYKVLEEQKRVKESTKRKLEASEEKCIWSISAPEVMTSSEASSSEARSPEAEVHQEMRDLKLQRLFIGFYLVQHCRRLKECSNGSCERIWKHWMLVLTRALTKDNCTNCTTTSSTTLFVSLQQDKNNSYACNNVPSN